MPQVVLEPGPTAVNGPVVRSGFSISAGSGLVRATLGVKGSQVQILSSRQVERARYLGRKPRSAGVLFPGFDLGGPPVVGLNDDQQGGSGAKQEWIM